MEENIDNMNLDDVLDVITDFPVQPLGRKILITLNVAEMDGQIVLSDNSFSETQYVVATGTHVHDVKAGNKVMLDIEKLMEFHPSQENAYERTGTIKIKPVEVNGRVYGMINENVIEAIDLR